MTTVAWDGRVLAADRMAVYSSTPYRVRKLFECERYCYGATGFLHEAIRIAEWLAGGARREESPGMGDGGCNGIVVDRLTGQAFTVEGNRATLVRIRSRTFATGSGGDFARAAMAMGKGAIDAVKVASKLDIYTGLGVDYVTCRKGRKVST